VLNNLRIRTKLLIGFVIVLVLLVAVWLTGWFAISNIVSMTKEMNGANEVAIGGLQMQEEILNAQIASDNETITRKKEWADLVKEIVSRIKDKYGNLHEKMKLEDTKKAFTETMAKLDKFGNSDANFWKTEEERIEAVGIRTPLALDCVKNAEELANNIFQVTKKDYAVTQNDKKFVDDDRVDLVVEIGILENYVRDLCILCFRYDETTDEKSQAEIRTSLTELFSHTGKEVKKVEDKLTSVEGKQMMGKLKGNLAEFEKYAWKVVNLGDKLQEINGETTKFGKEMVEQINIMVGFALKRANDALDQAQNTGTTMTWVLISTSIFAIIVGLCISFVLTSNITTGVSRAVLAMRTIADDGDTNFVGAFSKKG